MDRNKLDKWAAMLLDTGKRNNLVNFRETRMTTAKVLVPSAEDLLRLVGTAAGLEVYDPGTPNEEETEPETQDLSETGKTVPTSETPIAQGSAAPSEELLQKASTQLEKVINDNKEAESRIQGKVPQTEAEYLAVHEKKLRRKRQVLLYNSRQSSKTADPVAIVRNIDKKARGILEETGVNVAYMAVGFIQWKENPDSEVSFQAPLLLVPVTFERTSVTEPYYIKAAEDEVVVNPTFSYMMKAQYGLSLPEYEEESLAEYLEKVSQLVKGLQWSVLTECRLGLFSFLKINMYQDFKENADQILAHPGVRMLMGEPASWEDAGRNDRIGAEDSQNNPGEGVDAAGAGRRPQNPLTDLHSVVDADSSQIEAIEMARSGKSYVLQGPPGTGKSQTITNIIAECLSADKKVLFVSEKLAALNVVYDKLKKAGLSDFCLELHSHKANKREVIAELCRVLQAEKSTVKAKASEEIETKKRMQRRLDTYEAELHRERPVIEKSLYQLYEAFSPLQAVPRVKWAIPGLQEKGTNYRQETSELLLQYEEYVPSIGYDYRRNPWYGYCGQETSRQAREELQEELSKVRHLVQSLLPVLEEISGRYGIACCSIEDARFWQRAFLFLASADLVTPQLLKAEVFNLVDPALSELQELGGKIRAAKQQLDADYDEELYDIDAAAWNKLLMRQFNSFGSRLFNTEYREIMKRLRLVRKDGRKLSYAEALELTENLAVYTGNVSQFEEKEREILPYLGSAYQGLVSDWELVKRQMDGLYELLEERRSFGTLTQLQDLSEEKENFAEYSSKLENALAGCEENVLEHCESRFDPNVLSIQNSNAALVLHRVAGCLLQLEEMGRTVIGGQDDVPAAAAGAGIPSDGAREERRCTGAAAAEGRQESRQNQAVTQLEQWCRFRRLLRRLEEKEILPFLHRAIAQNLESEQFEKAFRRLFFEQWIDAVIEGSEVLSDFNRTAQDQAVQVFRDKDKEQFEINKAVIRAQLSAKRPNLSMMVPGSAVAMLRREGEKKRRQKSIRTLLLEMGELVQTLKPCLLMSPLSVSTFLDADSMHFDVVIFDEASQIFPQDAIGAIYRADQMIVVGDSKQMPPSNFFQTVLDPEEEDEEAGDVAAFESILDLCTATLPQLRLKWHYRSRSEKLISFSNRYFYENELVTFRAAREESEGTGVTYHDAGGTFDRTSHTNRKEAEYIVDRIYEELERHPKRSIGVVAFSAAQQDLIDRLLEKRRKAAPQKDYLFLQNGKEPLFIKNLETVQGDERDTILLSVAYGPGSDGRLLYHFGPLNRVGGERRLNVAVTRARCSVQVIASMHAADIDLTRTTAEGARLLRTYLDYAEHAGEWTGDSAAEDAAKAQAATVWDRQPRVQSTDTYDSPFEMEVCDFLRSRGFTVDTQVGCAGYRIDLAVRRPESSDYVLAVECDGASYHSAKNARDRDRLRQEVLEGMGWTFYRIWSTDWFRNSFEEKRRLTEAAAAAVQKAEHALKMTEGERKAGQTTSDPAMGAGNDHVNGSGTAHADGVQNLSGGDGTAADGAQLSAFEEKPAGMHVFFPPYRCADIENMRHYRYEGNLQAMVKAILEVETPLSEELLLKRILWWFDRQKLTSAVSTEYERQMYGCHRYGITREGGFLYLDTVGKRLQLRVDGDLQRELRMVAPEELAAGMLTLIEQNVTVEREDLYRMIAGLFGIARMGRNVEQHLDKALKLIDNKLEIRGDQILLRDDTTSA